MISSDRINSVHHLSDGFQIPIDLSHEEVQEILESYGYKIIETNMMVDIPNKESDKGTEGVIGVGTELKPVFLCLLEGEETPKEDERLEDHIDKWYFRVIENVVKKKFIESLKA